jgi:hypothetical protein
MENPVPPAEPNTFRRLVEGKITPEEYVRNLDERVQQTREADRPASAVQQASERA